MVENLMIIVTGASATGKTTLSKSLGNEFNIDCVGSHLYYSR